jgi:hypothetical protein
VRSDDVQEMARFVLEDGGEVVVEVDPGPRTTRVSRRDDLVADAKVSFEKALESIRDAASSALDQLRSMTRQPDEVELKFAVKLSGSRCESLPSNTSTEPGLAPAQTYWHGPSQGHSRRCPCPLAVQGILPRPPRSAPPHLQPRHDQRPPIPLPNIRIMPRSERSNPRVLVQ